MELLLERKNAWPNSTTGDLLVDGVPTCHTLEDVVREIGPNGEGKVQNETAIPAGRYRVIVNLSPRFQKLMMRLLDVPHFTGILMHGGNWHLDTHGCILLGLVLTKDGRIRPGTSTPAVELVMSKVMAALERGEEAWITITNDGLEKAA